MGRNPLLSHELRRTSVGSGGFGGRGSPRTRARRSQAFPFHPETPAPCGAPDLARPCTVVRVVRHVTKRSDCAIAGRRRPARMRRIGGLGITPPGIPESAQSLRVPRCLRSPAAFRHRYARPLKSLAPRGRVFCECCALLRQYRDAVGFAFRFPASLLRWANVQVRVAVLDVDEHTPTVVL